MPEADLISAPVTFRARRPLILAACMAASFMAAVEATIMATAMPSIAADLGGFDLYAWAFSAYMLAQAATIPIYGRLADMYGRRSVFYGGAGLFLIGSTLCGFSHSMLQLVVFRALQGLGAGGVQPIANTIVGDIYSPVERARVQGMLSGVFGVSAIIGPSLGAFIVQYGEWPLVFWINLPIGIAAITMIALFLPEHANVRQRRVDYLGSALLIIAVTLLMLLAMQWGSLAGNTALALIAVLIATCLALALHERRTAEPMLPLELWRNRVIVSSNVGSLITGILMMGVTAYLPTYIQGEMERGPDVAAIVLALMSVVWVLGSTAAGLYLPRATYRRIASLGAILLTVGAVVLITLTPARGPGWAAVGALLIGLGMGFCNTTFMISVQTSVAWEQRGAATSSTMFLRFLGQSLGAALFTAMINASLLAHSQTGAGALAQLMDTHWRASQSAGDLAALIATTAAAMRHAYLLTLMLAVMALMVALTYPARLGPATQSRQK
ncbi:MAG TPA: MDR family MFS transporter [Acetobacteraceae bacterium]|jgi:EmrB/QacA subfamily drug resistance transporter|nr:MDR family MFS transporter [Acetobacteraceae bacterium]